MALASCSFGFLLDRALHARVADFRSNTASSGWSLDYPFGGQDGPSTAEYPFSVTVSAKQVPSWGYWQGSKITDNLPPSPVTCTTQNGDGDQDGSVQPLSPRQLACGSAQKIKLVPFGLTNIRISVFPWM